MEITNGNILAASNEIGKLMAKELPIKDSLRIAKLSVKLEEAARPINEVRVKLVQKYLGKPGVITPAHEKWPEFAEEAAVLLQEASDIDLGQKVTITADGLTLTPATLLALEPFLEVK